MQTLSKYISLSVIVFAALACENEVKRNEVKTVETAIFTIPEIDYPEDNLPSPERIELGRALYNEPLLSLDSSISCSSCHSIGAGLADSKAKSLGVGDSIGFRNSPTLFNVAYQPYFFADGGVPKLELQVLAPIADVKEMHMNIVEAAQRLENIHYYDSMSRLTYDRKMDPYVITRALACFERTLLSFESKYDSVQIGLASYTASEERGKNLFFSERTNCYQCHQPPFFTDFSFRNIGLERQNDLGRMRITAKEKDKWFWKVPTLRNIALTAPYFHDGSKATLSEVITFFNKGGGPGEKKDPLVHELNLTSKEQEDLASFLRTLTDTTSFRKNW